MGTQKLTPERVSAEFLQRLCIGGTAAASGGTLVPIGEMGVLGGNGVLGDFPPCGVAKAARTRPEGALARGVLAACATKIMQRGRDNCYYCRVGVCSVVAIIADDYRRREDFCGACGEHTARGGRGIGGA